MLGHEQFLKDLVDHKDGLKVHSIHFVEKAILDKDPQGQLDSIGLENFEPIFFSVKGDNYCKDGQLNSSSSDYSALNGGTINIKVNGKVKQVILVQNDFPIEFDDDAEAQKDYEAMRPPESVAVTKCHKLESLSTQGFYNSLFVLIFQQKPKSEAKL